MTTDFSFAGVEPASEEIVFRLLKLVLTPSEADTANVLSLSFVKTWQVSQVLTGLADSIAR
jgi:hypothetical protein